MNEDKIIKFPPPGSEKVRKKTQKCPFRNGSTIIPRSFYYLLRKYDNDLYISGDTSKLIISAGTGDSLALIQRKNNQVILVIPPDLQDEIALLDGDTVEVELVKYRYRPPEIHLRLSIDEKDSLETARKLHDKNKKNDKGLW